MPPKNNRDFKDHGGTASTVSSAPSRRQPQSSDSVTSKGRILQFVLPVKTGTPQDPEPTPNPSCGRPCTFILDAHRDNIVAAARRGQHYRSIAAQYGLNALQVWKIVTDALQAKRAA